MPAHVCHACAKCRQVLHFSTHEDGNRVAACCDLMYIVDPDLPTVVYVSLFAPEDAPPESVGEMDLDSPDYRSQRVSCLDEARRRRGR